MIMKLAAMVSFFALVSCAAPQESTSSLDALQSRDKEVNGFAAVSSMDRSAVSCDEQMEAGWSYETVGTPGPQLRFDREPLTDFRVGLIRATFADAAPETRETFPSVEVLESLLTRDDSRVQSYFDDISYGTFNMSGEFIADVVLNVDASIDGRGAEISDFGPVDVLVPDFSEEDFDALAFVIISDYLPGISKQGKLYSPEAPNLTINGQRLRQLCNYVITFGHVGTERRLSDYPLNDDFGDLVEYVTLPGTEGSEVEVMVPLTKFERTFVHELIHALGLGSHAYSSTNGDRYHNATEIVDNQDFLWKDYGNRFDIMGSGEYAFGLNGAYRHQFGWIPESRTIRIDEPTAAVSVRLEPLDSAEGVVLAEVRLPFQYFGSDPALAALERIENAGYFIEVWPTDDRNYWASDVGIIGGSNGIVIYRTDGITSAILDASPSRNFEYSWGIDDDLSDIALRRGGTFDDGVIRLENVQVLDDGAVTFDVSVL